MKLWGAGMTFENEESYLKAVARLEAIAPRDDCDEEYVDLLGRVREYEQRNKTITFTTELSKQEAMALAQFVKRFCFDDVRLRAVSDHEAYQMVYALGKVRKALAEEGYAPR